MLRAIDAGLSRRRDAPGKGDRDATEDAERDALGAFYRGKEPLAFELHVAGRPPVLLLIAPETRKHPESWRVRTSGARTSGDPDIPPEVADTIR